VYVAWHCGDEVKKVSPLKNLSRKDVANLKRGPRTFTELKRLMGCIDRAATEGGKPTKKIMTPSEAHECYMAGERGLTIPTVTEKGRPRNIARLKWRTAVKYLPKEDKEN